MASKIRILLIDDSVVVRKVLAEILARDPEILVVGSAANGSIGLAKIPQLNPDLVVLDLEMPEMDGLETLTRLRRVYPKLPVIMFSSLTERGAVATLQALEFGANDYVTKPSTQVSNAGQYISEQLIPKIKALWAKVNLTGLPALVPPVSNGHQPLIKKQVPPAHRRVDIVAIGVSTGGPNALALVIPEIPKDFPVPIVIVQHMPPIFTKMLAESLARKSQVAVVEAQSGDYLHPGGVWIAPGDFHMVVGQGVRGVRIELNQGPPENSCRPAVDPLFRSVAQVYGYHSLGVVMTGMGQDGLNGSELIQAAQGQVWAQDEATSVVWGMPGFVSKAGLADKIIPLDQIAFEIIRKVNEHRSSCQ